MSQRLPVLPLTLACSLAVWAPIPTRAQVCEPVENGHLADALYEGTVIFWQPVVDYREMVLTIGGPCEDIVKVFGSNQEIFFDRQEIERVVDGQYTWELRRVAPVDPGVQKELEASRGSGEEEGLWSSFFQDGAISAGPYVESRTFAVVNGQMLIPEHAAFMWEHSCLPAVGTTPDGETLIDVFEKATGILQELEEAHIYIDQLHGAVEGLVLAVEERDRVLQSPAAQVEGLQALVETLD